MLKPTLPKKSGVDGVGADKYDPKSLHVKIILCLFKSKANTINRMYFREVVC